MKYDVIKKSLIKELIVTSMIIAAAWAVYYGKTLHEDSLKDDLNKIKREISQESSAVKSTQKDYENISQSLEIYEKIPKIKLPTEHGYNNLSARIKDSKPIILELISKYNFFDFNVIISPPENTTHKGLKEHLIYTDEIKLNFYAASDELVYSFIDEIIERIPGYIFPKEVNIRRMNDITQDFLNYTSGVSQDPEKRSSNINYPIKGSLTFVWSTIKGEPIHFKRKDINQQDNGGKDANIEK